MISIIKDFLSLFFPDNCHSCGNSLYKNERVICTSCLHHLPKTEFHLLDNNYLSEVFWGRVKIEKATACFKYGKSGKVQDLVHQFKYKGKKHIGLFFGQYYGKILKQTGNYDKVDFIVPVPLHEKKQRKRGFNQSEIFAKGLSEIMHIPIDTNVLSRKLSSNTQTKKNRFRRWENVSGIFELVNHEKLRNAHILLVDDVITTGATIEACCHALKNIPGIKVSIAAIAFTKK